MTIKLCFVCMGNICRSPTAEGVFQKLIERRELTEHFLLDSAGTHAYHVGESPDGRSQRAALARGINISQQRARQVTLADLDHFDMLLAMDEQNYRGLQQLASSDAQRQRIRRMMEFAPALPEREVPDPYYGEGGQGFERVLNLLEHAAEGLLTEWLDQIDR
ncbi:MAG: low molecular weight phosphotyrosine protein phosphatase [Immundisolibacteraceae bacterium]|nr:low molecular weight phosphotyrosine protein phosphatase [Immundisolibacteraceae bacterium]